MRDAFVAIAWFLGLGVLIAQAEEAHLSFRSPREGKTVAGLVRLEARLPEGLGPATLNYYLDLPDVSSVPDNWQDYVLGGSNSNPFFLGWDSGGVEEGRHSLTAVCTLDTGEVLRTTVTVFVQK